MANVTIHYNGGPCAGGTSIPQPVTVGDVFTCANARYVVEVVGGGVAEAYYSPQAQSGVLKAPSAMMGWNDLKHVVERVLPDELHRADEFLRFSSRALNRIRVRH